MKLTRCSLSMTALTSLIIASGCSNGPTGLSRGETSLNNGGSYGSGGRMDDSVEDPVVTAENGGWPIGTETADTGSVARGGGATFGSGN